jgi:hypothetical protein
MNIRYLAMLAQGLIFIGWFVLVTLKTTVGSAGLEFHFYEVAAIIANPLRLLTGTGASAGFITIPFALLCLALILAPMVPAVGSSRFAPAIRLAPLALMLVCGAILFYQTQQDTFTAGQNTNEITTAVVNLTNALARHTGQLVARHISLGAGSWLAGAGALLFACTGMRKTGNAVQAIQ